MERTAGDGAHAMKVGSPKSDTSAAVELRLPDEPVVVIEPRGAWSLPDLRELWAHRELLFFLTWRDIKVRYKQTVLGAAWALLQPLLTMLIFTFIFGRMARISSDGMPYPIFAYAGLVPWLFFANAVTNSSNSIVGSSHLITKVYFPRLLIPAAAITAALLDLALAFALLIPMAYYYHVAVGASILLLPVPILLMVLLALAVGLWLSALNVKYRDIRYTIPFVLQIGMFVSPVAYPVSVVPADWHNVFMLNPMAGILGNIRAAIFGLPFDWIALAVSGAFTLAFLLYATMAFRRMERSFADII